MLLHGGEFGGAVELLAAAQAGIDAAPAQAALAADGSRRWL